MHTEDSSRIGYLDSIKGIAIILVCVGHLIQSNVVEFEGKFIHSFIFAIQMPLFMIVSGYFSQKGPPDSFSALLKTISQKAVAYLLPYLSRIFIFEVLVGGKVKSIPARLSKIFPYHIDAGLWYLYVIFFLFVALHFALFVQAKLTKKKKTHLLFTMVLFGAFLFPWAAITAFLGTSFMGAKLILYYSIFYFIGYLWKQKADFIKQIDPTIKNIVCASCLCVGIFLITHFQVFSTREGIGDILIRLISGGTLSIVLISLIKKYTKPLERLHINRIGKYSLEIYYVHGIFTSLLAQKIKPLFYSIDGVGLILVNGLIMIVFTTISIVVLKNYPVLNFLLFAKKTEKKEKTQHGLNQ